MQGIDKVASTALMIAEIRSDEERRSPRLFSDPYARLFSQPEIAAATQRYQEQVPIFTSVIRARTRWADDLVVQASQSGTTQILTLGAGLCCRSLRFARAGVSFFEVDRPELLAYKAERLSMAGHKYGAISVGADYTAPGFAEALAAKGFDRSKRTLIVWEGNTFYLPEAKVREVLRGFASMPEVRIAFDCMGTKVIAGQSKAPGFRAVAGILRSIGAPWQSGFDDLPALAKEVGLSCVSAPLAHEVGLPLGLDLGADREAECSLVLFASR